jgi:hypothetical protein
VRGWWKPVGLSPNKYIFIIANIPDDGYHEAGTKGLMTGSKCLSPPFTPWQPVFFFLFNNGPLRNKMAETIFQWLNLLSPPPHPVTLVLTVNHTPNPRYCCFL